MFISSHASENVSSSAELFFAESTFACSYPLPFRLSLTFKPQTMMRANFRHWGGQDLISKFWDSERIRSDPGDLVARISPSPDCDVNDTWSCMCSRLLPQIFPEMSW